MSMMRSVADELIELDKITTRKRNPVEAPGEILDPLKAKIEEVGQQVEALLVTLRETARKQAETALAAKQVLKKPPRVLSNEEVGVVATLKSITTAEVFSVESFLAHFPAPKNNQKLHGIFQSLFDEEVRQLQTTKYPEFNWGRTVGLLLMRDYVENAFDGEYLCSAEHKVDPEKNITLAMGEFRNALVKTPYYFERKPGLPPGSRPFLRIARKSHASAEPEYVI